MEEGEMTVYQATECLKRLNLRGKKNREALRVILPLIPVIPDDPSPIGTRFDKIRKAIADSRGFDPFGAKERRRRKREYVLLRQSCFHQLLTEGFTPREIGSVTGYDRTTIYIEGNHFAGWLSTNDPDTVKAWREFNEILSSSTPR